MHMHQAPLTNTYTLTLFALHTSNRMNFCPEDYLQLYYFTAFCTLCTQNSLIPFQNCIRLADAVLFVPCACVEFNENVYNIIETQKRNHCQLKFVCNFNIS